MIFKKFILVTVIGCLPGFAQAAIVEAASYLPDAGGNWSYSANDQSILANQVTSGVDGTLDSYTVWVQENSPASANDSTLTMTMLGGHTSPFPALSDVLATMTFAAADIYSGPTVAGGRNANYYALTWDLSALNIDVMAGDDLFFRFESSTSAAHIIAGNSVRTSGAGPAPSAVNLYFGSPAGIGSGTILNGLSFALTVDDGTTAIDPVDPVAPVPLPAGLPLLLAGLGVLGLIRHRS